MQNLFAKRLIALASDKLQERYILNGTKEAYLVPEEILNDAYDCVRLVQEQRELAASLTGPQKEAILALETLLDKIDVDFEGDAASLLASAQWKNAKEYSVKIISILGENMHHLEEVS